MASPPQSPDRHHSPPVVTQERLTRKRKKEDRPLTLPPLPLPPTSSSLARRVSVVPQTDTDFPRKRIAFTTDLENEVDSDEEDWKEQAQRVSTSGNQVFPLPGPVATSSSSASYVEDETDRLPRLPVPDFSTTTTTTTTSIADQHHTPPQSPTYQPIDHGSPPERGRFILPTLLPPTPARGTHVLRFEDRESYKTFPGCQLSRTPSSRFSTAQSYWTYDTALGKTHALVCQPTSKGCGPAAATMLLLDLIPSGQEGRLLPGRADSFTTRNYWTWHMTKQLANVQNVADTMNTETSIGALGYRAVPVIYYYSQSDYEGALKEASENPDSHERAHVNTESALLSDLQNKITSSGQPVILAITHHKLAGHFIIVDEYKPDTDEYFVRDPYSNHAYKIDGEDLEGVIDHLEGIGLRWSIFNPLAPLPKKFH